MIQGIIFDWDGVIADSLSYYYKFLKMLSEKENKEFPYRNFTDFKIRMPQSFSEAVRILGIKSNNPFEEYGPLYKKYMGSNISIFKGMKSLIETKPMKFGIASAGLQHIIESMLKKENLSQKFSSIIGYKDGIRMKPEPDALLLCAREMKIGPKNAIYVGDFYTDIIAAKRAGMKSIAVTWGYSTKEVLKQENPDFIAERPKDIWKIVDQLNNGAA
ncbi:MAG: HAD family hydrolase [Candidatus Aenigmarchaeota archaeon]|nr:HAD family hydrolase [Candidatus Aenigmarchaeota archaeon]